MNQTEFNMNFDIHRQVTSMAGNPLLWGYNNLMF
jgi:hypothetical protein